MLGLRRRGPAAPRLETSDRDLGLFARRPKVAIGLWPRNLENDSWPREMLAEVHAMSRAKGSAVP